MARRSIKTGKRSTSVSRTKVRTAVKTVRTSRTSPSSPNRKPKR